MNKNSQGGKNSQAQSLKHLDLETADAASSGDFTGLIPAGPGSGDNADYEAYEDIHSFGSDSAEKVKKQGL